MNAASTPFFVVFAKDKNYVSGKIDELNRFGVSYVIVCGEHFDHPLVAYRAPKGKYDAITSALGRIPKDAKIVAFNDVDTQISAFETMLRHFDDPRVAIVFAPELVIEGPQRAFFTIFNPIRRFLPLAASGELLMIRQEVLRRILPLKPCKAEDTYIMFKTLELGYKVVFCEECCAQTTRTKTGSKEEIYKRKTVAGIYQALSMSKPPPVARFLYALLPFAAIFLVILGRNGYHIFKGILLGFLDYMRGDRSGTWDTTYMK